MAYKKAQTLSERDRTVLKTFLDCRVPAKFFDLDARGNSGFDFNYSYQELYDYADALLRGQEISLRQNFVGLAAVSVNAQFRKILDVVARRDATLADFCEKFSLANETVERLAR